MPSDEVDGALRVSAQTHTRTHTHTHTHTDPSSERLSARELATVQIRVRANLDEPPSACVRLLNVDQSFAPLVSLVFGCCYCWTLLKALPRSRPVASIFATVSALDDARCQGKPVASGGRGAFRSESSRSRALAAEADLVIASLVRFLPPPISAKARAR